MCRAVPPSDDPSRAKRRGRQGQMDGRTEGCGSLAAASGESPDEINTVILLVALDKQAAAASTDSLVSVVDCPALLLSAEARLSS